MRKLAILCLVVAAVALVLSVVARAMGGLPVMIVPGALRPLTLLHIAKLFILAAIPLALLEKK